MGVSPTQRAGVDVFCQCGCGQVFTAFPVYGKKFSNKPEYYREIKGERGATLYVPLYRRGHHPNVRQFDGNSWNTGLTKKTSSKVARQGRAGELHWHFQKEMHPDWFAKDFDFREFANQFGKKPRSKGSNKAYAAFRRAVMERDNYTCQDCGMVADCSEESDLLHVHHVVFVKHDKSRIFDPSNVITLCCPCHRKRHSAK